jgi:hypothetical protein
MINNFINPYHVAYDLLGNESGDEFQQLFSGYIESMDTCLQDAFLALYKDEVFGLDTYIHLKDLNSYMVVFQQMLTMFEDMQLAVDNGETVVLDEWITEYHLDCDSLKTQFSCMDCNYDDLSVYINSIANTLVPVLNTTLYVYSNINIAYAPTTSGEILSAEQGIPATKYSNQTIVAITGSYGTFISYPFSLGLPTSLRDDYGDVLDEFDVTTVTVDLTEQGLGEVLYYVLHVQYLIPLTGNINYKIIL